MIAAQRAGTAFLEYRDGDDEQRIVALGAERDRLSIGRLAGCEVALTWDTEVSRAHALLEQVGGAWTVEDRGSSNGTLVNAARINGPQVLRDGDVVRVGRTQLIFHAAGDDDLRRTTPAIDRVAPEPDRVAAQGARSSCAARRSSAAAARPPTARSPRRCSSAWRRSRPTCARCSTRSRSATCRSTTSAPSWCAGARDRACVSRPRPRSREPATISVSPTEILRSDATRPLHPEVPRGHPGLHLARRRAQARAGHARSTCSPRCCAPTTRSCAGSSTAIGASIDADVDAALAALPTLGDRRRADDRSRPDGRPARRRARGARDARRVHHHRAPAALARRPQLARRRGAARQRRDQAGDRRGRRRDPRLAPRDDARTPRTSTSRWRSSATTSRAPPRRASSTR